MKTVLALDISSSTIGWSILAYDDSKIVLQEYGHIKPPKSSKGSLAFRASGAYDEMYLFLKSKKPDVVAVEAYANKFPKGRSTARTIIVLSVFNELMSIASIKALSKEPVRYAVATIRASLGKLAGCKVSSKEEAFEFVKEYFEKFTPRENRRGNIATECYDEADSIAVALTHIYKERLDA